MKRNSIATSALPCACADSEPVHRFCCAAGGYLHAPQWGISYQPRAMPWVLVKTTRLHPEGVRQLNTRPLKPLLRNGLMSFTFWRRKNVFSLDLLSYSRHGLKIRVERARRCRSVIQAGNVSGCQLQGNRMRGQHPHNLTTDPEWCEQTGNQNIGV